MQSSSPSRYYIPCTDEDVATKTHYNCKIPLPLKIQVSWTQTNTGRRFKECTYDDFLAPSSDDELPATFNDGELQSNNVGEIEVSKMLIGMIEEELRTFSSVTPRQGGNTRRNVMDIVTTQ
ncbi:hypothetical protein Tco_0413636 [Tanacetum coccineum]